MRSRHLATSAIACPHRVTALPVRVVRPCTTQPGVTDDPALTQWLLELVPDVPMATWGRDELGTGDMWNSNSLTSWLLARSGLRTDNLTPPSGGRAPGWVAGLVVADRQPPGDRDPNAPVLGTREPRKRKVEHPLTT